MTPEEKNKKLTELIAEQKKEIVETSKQLKSLQSDLLAANAQLLSLADQDSLMSLERDRFIEIVIEKDGQINALAEALKIEQSKNTNGSHFEDQIQILTVQRDNALESIIELSTQVADHSKIKTEKEILVKVDGVKYLLERRTMHTLDGEVTAEAAAKNEDFLRTLISSGGGNIRLAK